MPELPEVTAYVEAFERFIVGRPLVRIRLRSPSLVRTFDPPLREAEGREVIAIGRIGKRVVWHLEGDLHLVVHPMITGRFHRKKPGATLPKKYTHAAFDFPDDTFFLTEMSKKKRASLHLVRGRDALHALDPGGIDPVHASAAEFRTALTRENRTLKRALTDPRIFSGIGNAHSDEILLFARLSPVQRTGNLGPGEIERLRTVTARSLTEWTRRLREEFGDRFPEKITAFHPGMAAHGRYGDPCPVCGTPIQRIRYADRETNYCPTCQTGGKLLTARGISRLLGDEWPRSLADLEELRSDHGRDD